MDEAKTLALIAFTAERQRQAVQPTGQGGYTIDHVDPPSILEAFEAQYQAPTPQN